MERKFVIGGRIMSQTEVREIEKDEYHIWDRFVNDSPQGTIYHLSDWIIKCSSLLDNNFLLLGFFEDNELRGGCSLYINSKLKLYKSATSNAPLTPYSGFLLPNHEKTKVRERESEDRSIISSLSSEISKSRFEYIDIINSPKFQDIRPLTWDGWTSQVYYTYILPLVGDISQSISKKVRNTVRKAEKNNIHIRKCYDPDLYWKLYTNTYEKQNLNPPVSKAFLIGMLDMIMEKNLGDMWVAETESGEPASAEIVTWDTKIAHRWSAVSDVALKNTGATSLLLFEIFHDLQKRGFNEINLMAANTPQLTMFISSFNPTVVPYYGVKSFSSLIIQFLYGAFFS